MLRGPAKRVKSPRMPTFSAAMARLFASAAPLPSRLRSCTVSQLPGGLAHRSPASAWALRKNPWSVAIEAQTLELVDRDADGPKRLMDQAQRRFRVVLQMAVDLVGAQHQEVNRLRHLPPWCGKLGERHLGEAVAEADAQYLHA